MSITGKSIHLLLYSSEVLGSNRYCLSIKDSESNPELVGDPVWANNTIIPNDEPQATQANIGPTTVLSYSFTIIILYINHLILT
jgi:hypothetical protein